MQITKNMLMAIESRDFYEIYDNGGQKRICFAGYVYPNDGDYDVEWNVLEYCDMDFSLAEYLKNPGIYEENISSVTEYIDEETEAEVLSTANNWYDGKDTKPLRLSSLTMETPCGTYLDVDERELSLFEYMVSGLEAQGKWDIEISNVRMNENGAFVDVSYKWQLNAWEKHAEHKDEFFTYKDGAWYSPALIWHSSDKLSTEDKEPDTEKGAKNMTDAKVITDDKILIEQDDISVTLTYEELKNIMAYARTQIEFHPLVVHFFENDRELRGKYACDEILDDPVLINKIASDYEREWDINAIQDYGLCAEDCLWRAIKAHESELECYSHSQECERE